MTTKQSKIRRIRLNQAKERFQNKQRNAAIQTLSNFLLASSLAFSGTGAFDLLSKNPNMTNLSGAALIFIGVLFLTLAFHVHFLKNYEN